MNKVQRNAIAETLSAFFSAMANGMIDAHRNSFCGF